MVENPELERKMKNLFVECNIMSVVLPQGHPAIWLMNSYP